MDTAHRCCSAEGLALRRSFGEADLHGVVRHWWKDESQPCGIFQTFAAVARMTGAPDRFGVDLLP